MPLEAQESLHTRTFNLFTEQSTMMLGSETIGVSGSQPAHFANS